MSWTKDSTRGFAGASAGLLVLLALAHASSRFAEGPFRLWAFDPLRYLPFGWTIGIALAALAALLLLEREANPRPIYRAIGLGLIVSSVALFALLGSRYALLGDNLLRAQEAELGRSSPNEVGVMAILHAGARLLRRLGWGGGREALAAASLLAGAIFTTLALVFARRSARPWIVALGLLSGGVVELFCRYIEVYPLVLCAILGAVCLAWLAARDELHPAYAVLAIAVALVLHRVAALFIPAAIAPLLLARRSSIPRRLAIAIVLAPPLAMALLSLASPWRRNLLLAWSGSANRAYELMSPAHLSDYLNGQALSHLAGMLLAPFALIALLASTRIEKPRLVLLLAWWIPAVALFAFRPSLGSADWDLLAFAGPFAFLLGAEVWLERAPRWVARAIVLSAVVTLPWLVVQRSEVSVDRVSDLVRHDAADYYVSHPPEMHLAFLFGSNGLTARQEAELKRGAERFPRDPRYPYNLSAVYHAQSRWAEAEEQALRSYGLERGYILPLDVLYDVYRATGRPHDQFICGMSILDAHASDSRTVERYLSRARIDQIRREVDALPPSAKLDSPLDHP